MQYGSVLAVCKVSIGRNSVHVGLRDTEDFVNAF